MSSAIASTLATDLDGTFIPLEDEPRNRSDLKTLTELLERHHVPLIYVTGRHLESVLDKAHEQELPRPEWMICDVGTSIYRKNDNGDLRPVEPYYEFQHEIVDGFELSDIAKVIEQWPGLRRQEEEKQGPYKLSYYVEQEVLEDRAAQLGEWLKQQQAPWEYIHSVDPFTGDGLLDVVPTAISKAKALEWWCDFAETDHRGVVFAGDSGNDYAAFIAGYRTIVVANTDRAIAEKVRDEHARRGYENRLHLATQKATSGVLEGCHAFGVFE
ncbi:MAG: HAD-IIB family hydrolase [Rubinisphaera brasiliensis]|uniref:HAD-IIB family hydrolase n=1 Tax=Rubinisphaera brasiliensis TaxID=119 RepID=UPI00391B2A3B